MKQLRFAVILAVFVLALALQAIPTQAYSVSAYTKIYEGIEYATGYVTSPRLMRAFAIRVNLKNPDVATFVSPGNGGDPYDTTLQGTDTFLSYYGCKVAANCSHWDVNTPAPYADVLGLLIDRGTMISAITGPWIGQLNFTSDKNVSIVESWTPPTGMWNAAEVGDMVLTNGVPTTYAPAINPYTGFGISQDGKRLIIVGVDGRQPGWSDGCYYSELGQWMKDFGAWNAAHADGGGSTCLVRADIGVVNRPCYGYVRPVAASVGINSEPGNIVGPDACAMNSSRMDVVVRGNLNHVYVKTWTSAGGWGTWTDLGGYTWSDPAIVSLADGRLDVFINEGGTGYLKWKSWTSGGGWSGWTSLGTSIWVSGPAVCREDATHVGILARGAWQNRVWNNTLNISNGTLSGWVDITGNSSGTYHTPGICKQANGCTCAFIRNASTGTLYLSWRSGGTWYGWANLGGSLDGGPTAVCRSQNILDVFARGTNFTMQHISMNNSGVWSGWDSLTWTNLGKVGACAINSSTINTFHRGLSDELWLIPITNNVWGGLTSAGQCFY